MVTDFGSLDIGLFLGIPILGIFFIFFYCLFNSQKSWRDVLFITLLTVVVATGGFIVFLTRPEDLDIIGFLTDSLKLILLYSLIFSVLFLVSASLGKILGSFIHKSIE